MFDFSTAVAAPVRVNIDGTPYDLPRFLLPQFKAWVAVRQKRAVDEAMKQLGDDVDARARFMMYFQPAPVDVAQLAEEALTPEGIEYVLGVALKAAGLPDDKRAALLAAGDPLALRGIARVLLSAEQTTAKLKGESKDPGEKGNPMTGQPPMSGGSPETTPTTEPQLPRTSAESTPTA